MDKNELGIFTLLTARLTELQAAFRTLSKQPGPPGKDGVSVRGEDGKPGTPGKDGKDGVSIRGEEGKRGAPGKDGAPGPIGPMPAHEWSGTALRFQKPDGTWGKTVDLKGQPGKDGATRASGGGSHGFDPNLLDAATNAVPTEFIVRQNGTYVRATYAQMAMWFPGGGTGVPANAALVGGEPVMANGQYVTVT